MCLFLFLLWCSVAVGRSGGPNIVGDNSRSSRFGRFNSRLGRREFPVRAATGICRQGVDLPAVFLGKTAVAGAKSTKFPSEREKPGTLPLSAARAVTTTGSSVPAGERPTYDLQVSMGDTRFRGAGSLPPGGRLAARERPAALLPVLLHPAGQGGPDADARLTIRLPLREFKLPAFRQGSRIMHR
jgi:hypothetical protein